MTLQTVTLRAEFPREDLADSTAWRLCGKLNISRERFIHYAEFDHTSHSLNASERGCPYSAGPAWPPRNRADTLAQLLDRARRVG